MHTSQTPHDTVDHLNSFLRGELAAVETYRQALDQLTRAPYRPTLEKVARSHGQRAQLLSDEIRRRGGVPASSSGPWGTFMKLFERGAAAFGEKAAVAALEEGEDHGRNDYQRDMESLDPPARAFIQTSVLPEQQRTHDALSTLKKSFRS